MKQKAVCISPLDWGLGHATRCIPLIRALESLDFKIYIASEGKQETLLKEAFPKATFLPLKGYRIWYTRARALFLVGIMFQIPKILLAIVNEHFWLKRSEKKYHFDLIVSDNRFGFFHKNIKSVFITHQLEIQTPFKWSTRLSQIMSYSFIKKYAACWVADMLPPNNLSGVLANPQKLPNTHIWYMNCLSRLIEEQVVEAKNETPKKDACFLGMVSGPEPQRTLFENILWQQGNSMHLPFVVIAGLPDHESYYQSSSNGKLYHHLNELALKNEIKKADYIICRGGYTTLMELIPFQKKLILIPTPGQTEQEYLAKYWQEKNWAICFAQSNFNLKLAIEKAGTFEYTTPPFACFNKSDLENELKRISL